MNVDPPVAAPPVTDVPVPSSRRKRIGRGAIAALVLAVMLLGAGAVVLVLGRAAEQDAERERTEARRERQLGRAAHHRAETDLAAARAAIATFGASALDATTATGRVVELETALVDRLSRLREAGAAEDIGTYNRIVGELNQASNDLVAGFTALETPLETFSTALGGLPTARCTGAPARTITWTAYGGSGLQCARLLVPLDYAVPRGRQIDVTLVRRPADDPAASLGPLLLNPGGPGSSGISFMREALLLMPPELLRRFDLIGFDPRGVGHSSPVDCADDLDPLFDADLTATSPRVRAQAVRAIEQIVRGCAERTGDLLDHVDTMSAARDMDRMRVALGVKQISYLGFSYGTYLGAVYADLFPNRLRAAVFDGGVDPARATRAPAVDSGTGFDFALQTALDDCAANPSCPFFSNGNPTNAYERLMSGLIDQPLNVSGRRLGRAGAELAVVSGLYQGVAGWPVLMNALARANVGDGGPLSELRDSYTGRRADGSYDNEFEAHYAVDCIDAQNRLTRRAARADASNLDDDPERFDTVSLALALPCAFWPSPPHGPPRALRAEGAAPILVIGGENDPVTPIEGAQALTDQLDSARLLTSEATSHTTFARGSACVDDAVVAYLVDLRLPELGTICPAD